MFLLKLASYQITSNNSNKSDARGHLVYVQSHKTIKNLFPHRPRRVFFYTFAVLLRMRDKIIIKHLSVNATKIEYSTKYLPHCFSHKYAFPA